MINWNEVISELRKNGVEEVTIRFQQLKSAVEETEKSASQKQETVIVADCPETDHLSNFKRKQKKHDFSRHYAKIEAFKKEHKNWHTISEIADICELEPITICRMIKDLQIPCEHIGKSIICDMESLWVKRDSYEKDFLENDGHRKGPVKFISARLENFLMNA